jgi:hypothetical protein
MQPPDEATLIERARREPDAFAALYQLYLNQAAVEGLTRWVLNPNLEYHHA